MLRAFMFLAATNPVNQYFVLHYAGKMQPDELRQSRAVLTPLLATLQPGFCLLVDLSALESMGMDCREELGRNMDLFSAAGVGRVVRVIPDPSKDMGLNILAFFHYPHRPQIINCTTLAEALEKVLL